MLLSIEAKWPTYNTKYFSFAHEIVKGSKPWKNLICQERHSLVLLTKLKTRLFVLFWVWNGQCVVSQNSHVLCLCMFR